MTELTRADIRLVNEASYAMEDLIRKIKDSTDIEYLERLNEYADDTIGCLVGELFCGMHSKIKSLERARDFDIDMVQILPADVIHLIKEFMVDDIEYVRKAYVIYEILPLYSFLPEVSIGELSGKINTWLKKTNKKKLILAINNATSTWLPKNKKREYYVYFITTQFKLLITNFKPNTTLSENYKENLGRYFYKESYDLYRVLQILNR
jgi:hypothetical protein